MIVLCVCVCVCVCVSLRIRSAIVAIRENLWVHIQCICRFACFSRHGRIHGTLCVCASVCMGILSVSAFGTNVLVCACMCECSGPQSLGGKNAQRSQ